MQTRSQLRFVSRHYAHFQAWSERLLSTPGMVLAISRKGPRLIELMVHEHVLPQDFLGRVSTERALPFLGTTSEKILLADDSVLFGSTFTRITSLVRALSPSSEVVGLPFAVARSVPDQYRSSLAGYFYALDDQDSSAFVSEEVNAYRVLGKPLDIEHPIVYYRGDFSDAHLLEESLQKIGRQLGGTLVPIETKIPLKKGAMRCQEWSLLLDQNKALLGDRAELCKIRVFVKPHDHEIAFVPIRPFGLREDKFEALATEFPKEVHSIWQAVRDSVNPLAKDQHIAEETQRSLCMWANYLSSLLLFRAFNPILRDVVESFGLRVEWHGLKEHDIRLLLGPALCQKLHLSLDTILRVDALADEKPEWVPTTDTPRLVVEIIPQAYNSTYRTTLGALMETAPTVEDTVRAIFFAQHAGIEVPSRRADADANSRLEFGVTVDHLHNFVFAHVPNAKEEDFHAAIDRMIDEGSVVPRYMAVSVQGNRTWARFLRVGEGPTESLVHAIKLLFETLSKELHVNEIPSLLFEKYCVLVLCEGQSDDRLAHVRNTLGVAKGFHLYGARCEVALGRRRHFLTDWAVDHRVLACKNTRANDQHDESKGGYVLDASSPLYAVSDGIWDRKAREAAEDIASLVRQIHEAPRLKSAALVTLTSVATPHEHHQAIEAELDIWLHHPQFSVYKGLEALSSLAEDWILRNSPEWDRLCDQTNNTLAEVSNTTAQVGEKEKLLRERESTINQLNALPSGYKSNSINWL